MPSPGITAMTEQDFTVIPLLPPLGEPPPEITQENVYGRLLRSIRKYCPAAWPRAKTPLEQQTQINLLTFMSVNAMEQA
jgi:hypothetical protein